MNRETFKYVATMGLVAVGLLFALLMLSGSAVAGVDLTVSSGDITFTVDGQVDNSPTEDDLVTITAKVRNIGNDTNATNFYVKFEDGTTLIQSVLVVDNCTFNGGHVNVTTTWTAAVPGAHIINVTVDSTNIINEGVGNEGNNWATKQLTVNIAPSVVINVDAFTKPTLENFNFNASGSSDPDGVIVSFFWSFGDGSFANKDEVTHAYSNNAQYTVTLLITDDKGGTASTSVKVNATNRAPVARASDMSGKTYDIIRLDSSNSTDADGTIKNVTWYFEELTMYKYGKKISYVFEDDGIYTVNMTIMDDDGATDFKVIYVTIYNRNPSANIVANRTKINTTEWVNLDGSSSTDMDGSIVNYTWIFPGGINRYGPIVSYQFNVVNGSYQVTLVTTDDDGAIGFKSVSIKVGNKPPIVDAGLDTIADTYELIAFDGSGSYDLDGTIVNYTWNMGDGTRKYNKTTTHYYKDDGVYTVRLTIIDDEGASNTTTITATILNQVPVAFHSHVTVKTYTPYILNTSECTDLDGYIASVQWRIEDPKNTYTNVNGNTSYQWNNAGNYTVLMTITDDDGAGDAYQFNVSVKNSAPWAIFSFSPSTALSVGDDITFDASASVDLDGIIVNWTWYPGDSLGNVRYGELLHYTYMISGMFTMELRVTDNNGGSNTTSKTVYIAPKNDPPVPIMDVTANEWMTNRVISFDASNSYDPDGSIVKYEWDFGDEKSSFGVSVTHKYASPGDYTVSLTIEDNGGKTNFTTDQITLTLAPNLSPISSIDTTADSVVAGVNMIFDGRGSYDPDGWIVNYTWDFGDGKYAYSSYVSHKYTTSDVGTKTVRLTVTDNNGATNVDETTITVQAPPKKNVPPVAQFSFSPPEPILTGQEVRFDASSSTDSDGTITGYTWLFGDGTFAEGKVATHTYGDNNVYLVVLTVIDNQGGSGTISKDISVSNREPVPVITISSDTVQTLEVVTFDAGKSHDDDGFIKSYTWIFGTENTQTGKVVSYTFTSSGNKKVTLKTLDNDGATAETTVTVKVTNREPIARAGSNISVQEGTPIEFDASGSKDLDGSITQYHWDFGDGQIGEGVKVTHTYPLITGDAETVTYTVKLYVVDNDLTESETDTLIVTIIKKPKTPRPHTETGFIPGFDVVLALVSISVALAAMAIRKRH